MAKRSEREQITDPSAQGQEQTGGESQSVTGTRKPRVRDPRLDERDAIVKAWKEGGNKGLPEGVKVADFKRIGQRRLNEALDSLRKLAHVGNRSNYSYTDETAAAILAALTNAVSDVESAFAPKDNSRHRVEL